MTENEEALFEAAKDNNIEEVRRLLEAGVDVNAMKALIYALIEGHAEMIKLLEEKS